MESIFFEPECANYGSDWEIFMNAEASNGTYVTIKAGLNSSQSAPTGTESIITIPFSVTKDNLYYLFARVNCPSSNDDSFWIKIDDGEFTTANGLGTVGWQWASLRKMELKAGEHTLTIAYREDGALLDKINITSHIYGPEELQEKKALNICKPNFTKK
ncbi:MAG: hypothetical protein IPJ74_06195 [Saprospiraceae bacterium]|nr:hypothetical protein [Saprospiraceae bacterium]